MTRFLLVCALVTGPAAHAFAQGATSSSPQALADNDCARARRAGKPCVLTMDNEEIIGGVPTGNGTMVQVRQHASFASLIRVRADFRAEIIRTAEEL